MQKKLIEVDTKTFVRFWLVILGLGLIGLFIWKALTALVIIGIAIFLAIAIQPLAARIKRLTHSESSSASVIAYSLIILALALILTIIAPVVVNETVHFVSQLPATFQNTLGGWDGINNFGQTIGIDNLQTEIISAIQSFSNSFVANIGNFLVTGIGTVSAIVTNTVLVLILTLLFAIQGPAILRAFWRTMSNHQTTALVRAYQHLTERLASAVSTYVAKQVTVALLDGLVVTLVIFILSLTCGFSSNLAVPLGLIAMVFYLVPMFGPIISCALITLLLLFSSPVAGIIFLVFYIIYAQIENNVIAPKLQGDAHGLPSSIILASIVIGMYMFGLVGAIVAIPIVSCIKIVIEEIPAIRAAKEKC